MDALGLEQSQLITIKSKITNIIFFQLTGQISVESELVLN